MGLMVDPSSNLFNGNAHAYATLSTMETLTWEHCSVVPYLRRPTDPRDNRVVPLFPLWSVDDQSWHFWLPAPPPHGLFPMQPRDVDGIFIAKAPQRDSDLYIPFLDFMWKHSSWPKITRWLKAIENDIFKLAASLAKIDLFFECTDSKSIDHAIFVSTEIEYLLGRCRSLFDNLQMALNTFWNDHLELVDPEAQRLKKQQAPADSFSDVAKKIRARKPGEPSPYAFPEEILRCYAAADDFFVTMKDVRDKVVHRAAGVGSVYVLPQGFGIGTDNPITKLGPERKPDHWFNENVVALLPVLANVVCRTIYVCNAFGDAFRRIFKFPEPIISDHHVFLRTAHGPSVVEAQAVLKGKAPWRGDGAAVPVAEVEQS